MLGDVRIVSVPSTKILSLKRAKNGGADVVIGSSVTILGKDRNQR